MDLLTNKSIHYLWILHQYLQSQCPNSYPQEIIHIIIKLYLLQFKIKISAGGHAHYALLISGELYAWGNNGSGQLGLGHYEETNIPTKVDLSDVIKVACGSIHTLALTKKRDVYAWGNNFQGQLGLGAEYGIKYYAGIQHNICQPQKVKFENLLDGEFIIKIKCGGFHSLALTNLGNVYGWGNYKSYRSEMEKIPDVWAPRKLDISNSIKISCGDQFAMSLTSKGIVSWGLNNQLRYNLFQEQCRYVHHSSIKNIKAKSDCFVIATTDTIYMRNPSAATKDTVPALKKISIGNSYLLYLLQTGEVYVKRFFEERKKIDLPKIKDIYCHNDILFAITEMNEMYKWDYGKTPEKFLS
jgi:alpha-tubulin suppressor-like RCC1 family protein